MNANRIVVSLFFSQLLVSILVMGCSDSTVDPNENIDSDTDSDSDSDTDTDSDTDSDSDTETDPDTDTDTFPDDDTGDTDTEHNNILVLASDHKTDGQTWFHTLLANEADMDNVDYWNTDLNFDGSPTLDDLMPYDGIVTWYNSFNTNHIEVYDSLLQYIDAGGKVVATTWCFSSGFGVLTEPLASSPYSPFETDGDSSFSDPPMTLSSNYDEPTHDIVQNVVTPPSFYFYGHGHHLNPGATLIAHWDNEDEDPAIAINAAKNFVGFTGFVGEAENTGDYPLIVRNALVYMIEN